MKRNLQALLRRSGARIRVAELRDLVAGVAAAPVGFDPESWMLLVADHPSPELRAALSALLMEERRRHAPRCLRGDYGARLAALRAEMHRDQLTGFIVPRNDEHQGEYVPLLGAPRLADRLHRVGGNRRGTERGGGPVRRRPLHDAKRPTRSMRGCSPFVMSWSNRYRNGSPRNYRPMRDSATTLGCTRRTRLPPSSGRAFRPGEQQCLSTATSSTAFG